VEDSIYNSKGIVWTNNNVIWTHKFTNNVLDHNEQNSLRFNQHWKSRKFHWWYYSRDRRGERTWWDRETGEDISEAKGEIYKITSINSTRLRQKR